jgi:hypothetical protein
MLLIGGIQGITRFNTRFAKYAPGVFESMLDQLHLMFVDDPKAAEIRNEPAVSIPHTPATTALAVATLQLRGPGPAQSNLIYHFCGRPPGTGTSTQLDSDIAAMTSAPDRLANILWEGGLRGSPPFGAANRMVCFSESPVEHLRWLLHDQAFPPWALLVTREWVYSCGGGPVWYTREAQHRSLTPEQRNWAVRFERYTSDWLHEREWRIPVPPGFTGLQITADVVKAVLIGEPTWAPWRQVLEPTGYLIGMDGTPGLDGVAPEMAPRWRLPRLWERIPAFWWDRTNRRFVLVHAPAQS